MTPATASFPAVRDVRLLHAQPFGSHMLQRLRNDLKKAIWARWMVCYFNSSGLKALSPHLPHLLQDPRSRGLFTLTCSCGMDAVMALAQKASPPLGRLKVYLPFDGWGPEDARLLHSKMLFLVRARSQKSPPGPPLEAVLYVGSHNWTGPGLRVDGSHRRNVETSLRLIGDWPEEQESMWFQQVKKAAQAKHFLGNPFLDALVQMHTCFDMASCTDVAARRAEQELKEWMVANCPGTAPSVGSTTFLVLTGVLGGRVDAQSVQSGQAPPPARPPVLPKVGEYLYVQHYRQRGEPDAFDSNVVWAILLWEDGAALQNGARPWLFLCNPRELGQEQRGAPDLRDINWLVYDPQQNIPPPHPSSSIGSSVPPQRLHISPHHLRSGRTLTVEYWSVVPVKKGVSSNALNARTPDRHVLVEVIAVRRPADATWIPDRNDPEWRGQELPFHRGKRRSRLKVYPVHDVNGRPSEQRAQAMRREQEALFNVKLPAEDARDPRGPIGDATLSDGDIYPCDAPINDVLFRDMNTDGVRAQREYLDLQGDDASPERQPIYSVRRARQDASDEERSISRIENLMGPDPEHIRTALGLDARIVKRLGLND